jgi:signal transduction histidine kinase
VVYPWSDNGTLIGYVELGTEFETVAQKVHNLLGVDLIATVDKSLLKQDLWENRNKRLGRQTAWDDLPDVVVIDKTVDGIPDELNAILRQKVVLGSQATVHSSTGATYHVVFLPLTDVADRTLGSLVVLNDVTAVVNQARASFAFIVAVFMIVGGVLVAFFYAFLGRVGVVLDDRARQLAEANATLERRVRERTAELEETHRKLNNAARHAGRAEIANGVLHNVGNVLNSLNVSATVVADKVRQSKVSGLTKATQMIAENSQDLGRFFSTDQRGQQLPHYLSALSDALSAERESVLGELGELAKSLDHVKEIVGMQQRYAGVSTVVEPVDVRQVVEDAIRMNDAGFSRHHVKLVREFVDLPQVQLDKHKVLQILMNLLSNAKYATDAADTSEKVVEVRVDAAGERLRIAVSDNGVGIPEENLGRLFTHGFTTKKNGHGFGLHSSIMAARDMRGTLTAHSDGPGKGATFTLELPVQLQEAHR